MDDMDSSEDRLRTGILLPSTDYIPPRSVSLPTLLHSYLSDNKHERRHTGCEERDDAKDVSIACDISLSLRVGDRMLDCTNRTAHTRSVSGQQLTR